LERAEEEVEEVRVESSKKKDQNMLDLSKAIEEEEIEEEIEADTKEIMTDQLIQCIDLAVTITKVKDMKDHLRNQSKTCQSIMSKKLHKLMRSMLSKSQNNSLSARPYLMPPNLVMQFSSSEYTLKHLENLMTKPILNDMSNSAV
jgi:hypothetical protein